MYDAAAQPSVAATGALVAGLGLRYGTGRGELEVGMNHDQKILTILLHLYGI